MHLVLRTSNPFDHILNCFPVVVKIHKATIIEVWLASYLEFMSKTDGNIFIPEYSALKLTNCVFIMHYLVSSP